MARTLTFQVAGQTYAAAPVKVDRAKLYGWTETVALDSDGEICELALMDRGGTMVIPQGGTGVALLDAHGGWVERSSLVAVDADGSPVKAHPSSYDAPVSLAERASVEDLLDTPTTAVYQLDADPELAGAIGDDICVFDYFFRAGPSGSRAFVLASDGAVFMLTGQSVSFDFIGLETSVDVIEETGDDDDDDGLDFGMI